jgi:hypothetical protein
MVRTANSPAVHLLGERLPGHHVDELQLDDLSVRQRHRQPRAGLERAVDRCVQAHVPPSTSVSELFLNRLGEVPVRWPRSLRSVTFAWAEMARLAVELNTTALRVMIKQPWC